MPTEYARAFFNIRLLPVSFFGVSIRPTMDFWPYIAIFKTHCTPIRPLSRTPRQTESECVKCCCRCFTRRVLATKTSNWLQRRRRRRRWGRRRQRRTTAASRRRPLWTSCTASVDMTTMTDLQRRRTLAAGRHQTSANHRRVRSSHAALSGCNTSPTAWATVRVATTRMLACSSCPRRTSSTFPTSATPTSTATVTRRWIFRPSRTPRRRRRRRLATRPATAPWWGRPRRPSRACSWTTAGCRWGATAGSTPPRRRPSTGTPSATTAPESVCAITAVLLPTCCCDRTQFVFSLLYSTFYTLTSSVCRSSDRPTSTLPLAVYVSHAGFCLLRCPAALALLATPGFPQVTSRVLRCCKTLTRH